MWSGPESEHVRNKVAQIRGWRKAETDPNAIAWLDGYIDMAQVRLSRARVEEEREGR
jgi:hypothetical protein